MKQGYLHTQQAATQAKMLVVVLLLLMVLLAASVLWKPSRGGMARVIDPSSPAAACQLTPTPTPQAMWSPGDGFVASE